MIIQLLLALVALQPQQPNADQLQRGQQQLDQRVQQMQQQLDRVLQAVERPDQRAVPEAKPVCSAEIRWVTRAEQRKVAPSPSAVVPLNLFSTVSKPVECLPAEIDLTASYLDAAENLICSGVIERMAIQSTPTQSVNIDIRPYNLLEFARWRNEPPQTNSGAKRLACFNPDGLAEVTPETLARVASVRVRTTVLSGGSGISTAEVLLNLQR